MNTKLEQAITVLKKRQTDTPGLGIIAHLLSEHKGEIDTGQSNIYHGHIVHLTNLDSLDEVNVEVLIHEGFNNNGEVEARAELAAMKTDIATLTGNTFEAEYIQNSGKIVKVTKIREVLADTTQESVDILGDFLME